ASSAARTAVNVRPAQSAAATRQNRRRFMGTSLQTRCWGSQIRNRHHAGDYGVNRLVEEPRSGVLTPATRKSDGRTKPPPVGNSRKAFDSAISDAGEPRKFRSIWGRGQ